MARAPLPALAGRPRPGLEPLLLLLVVSVAVLLRVAVGGGAAVGAHSGRDVAHAVTSADR